ncbi:L-aspartate oxidase [Longibacter salinarum]|uniref:L-aspartate oxidase n=1 Tax=Longibacter salinarum TaxID=1850348 RepID=A0A2A8D2J2_9BACT|nr:L-aspartate oxidase [Longibacter salinarum]PEN15100.1 L-aspartate oxidase [Longibacter salinarum]
MDVYDFLVIGTGVAGLSYARRVAEHGSVALVTKDVVHEANTTYAQGGIAAVMDEEDTPESHIEDTLIAGAGLCDPDVVEFVVTEGPERVRALIELGASFTTANGNGELHLGREGGHSANRIVHAADTTGYEVEHALLDHVMSHRNIDVMEHHFAVDLITEHHLGQHVTRLRPDVHCFGAYVYDEAADTVKTILANVTMLAAGGSGQVYRHTTNPDVATGDGVAMASRAKARVSNMEFVQFHPTSLYHPDADSFLISEAVRGEGGRLFNQAGQRFMLEYDERAELAPRDIVARAIDDQMKQRGDEYVLLDISHRPASEIQEHFPHIYKTCASFGIDMTSDPIPVVPAAHYQCGGVQTDHVGRTSINGLFASGEVACTGLHGANRLASNSLLEGLVFSERAVAPSVEYANDHQPADGVPEWDASGTRPPDEHVLITHNRDELQRVMSNYVGIVRSELRLDRAHRRTRLLHEETEQFYQESRVSRPLCELRNMITVSYLIIECAKQRRESRGLHYILDYPEPSDAERRPTFV